jgi:putative spermidine/putrescine transport system ATP-binding protein
VTGQPDKDSALQAGQEGAQGPERTVATVTAPEAAVELESLTKTYGSVTAVDHVDLVVKTGELVSVLGASGSGKTTLLRLMAGFVGPTSGKIRLHGRDVSLLSPAEREVGMVFQNYALFPHLTVRRNIEYGLRMRGWNRADRRQRVDEMLERMRLVDLDHRQPGEISGGQQQRVALARALAYSPRLLLMDEPLGALDRALKEDLLKEIRRVHHEFSATIIYVTHDREEALTLSDRVALMDAGKLVVCDVVQELYLEPPDGFVAGFFSGANVIPLTSDVAKIVERSSTGARLRIGEHEADVRLRYQTAMPADEAMVLVVRPSALRTKLQDGDFRLEGQIVDTVFLGDFIHLRVEVDGISAPLTCVVARADANGISVGGRITLGFAPCDVRLVPRDHPFSPKGANPG